MSDTQPAPIIVDERRPLLADAEPLTANSGAINVIEDVEALEAEIEEDEAILEGSKHPKKKRTWWGIFWQVVFALAAIVILAVFIKGFIDADDVEVRAGAQLGAEK